MLVLSRKCEESLVINGDIEIKIVEISGDKVRIGVEAPQNYKILRKELALTVESNRQAALQTLSPQNIKGFMSEFKKAKEQQKSE